MAGGIYTALSGLHTRLESLDRLAADIANASTAGYKAERVGTTAVERPSFDDAFDSAIDVAGGGTRIDLRAGALSPTGRDLDLAVDGSGFFVVNTSDGTRFTRDGRLIRRDDGVLATSDTGDPVMGDGGPITVAAGPVTVDQDGTVRQSGAAVGKLQVVDFDHAEGLVHDKGSLFRNDAEAARPAMRTSIKAGALEQSNVSVPERLVDLTAASRNFEGLQRALSLLANDVDARAITELGRR